MNSLSALHDTQIGSSANYLDTNNVEPLTASSTKEKEIKLDCAKLGISQVSSYLISGFNSIVNTFISNLNLFYYIVFDKH
jgi:hypothetical protein